MTQFVKFEDKAWGRLATMADEQGMTIPELLERSARRLLVGTVPASIRTRSADLADTRAAHKSAVTKNILQLRKLGHTVLTIAERTGYSKSYVSKILCDNGARTHQRHTSETPTKETK